MIRQVCLQLKSEKFLGCRRGKSLELVGRSVVLVKTKCSDSLHYVVQQDANVKQGSLISWDESFSHNKFILPRLVAR